MESTPENPRQRDRLRVRHWPGPLRRLSAWIVFRRLKTHLIQETLAAIPPLSAKIRGRLVPEIIAQALEHEPDWQALCEESPAMRLATLSILLHRCVETMLAENKRVEKAYEVFARQVDRAPDEEARNRIILAYLRRNARSIWHYLGDRRALSRRFDLDAMRERVDEVRYWNFSKVEVIVGATHGLWKRALELAHDEHLEIIERAREAHPLTFLLGILLNNPRWPTRMMAGELLEDLIRGPYVSEFEPHWIARLREQIEDSEENPWVRRNAFRVFQRIAPELANSLRDAILTNVSKCAERDFLFRALLIADLCQRFYEEPQALDILERQISLKDPSEHVRLTLAAGFAKLPPENEEVWRLARMLADLDTIGKSQQSPKVRAQTLRSVGELFNRSLASALGGAAIDPNADLKSTIALGQLLALGLTRAVTPLVTRTACRQISSAAVVLAKANVTDRCALLFGMWTSSLTFLRSHDELGPRINEEAASALETLVRARHPRVWGLYAELSEILSRVPQGHSKVIDLRSLRIVQEKGSEEHPITDLELGRAFADLSRRDWGLYGTRRGNRLIVQRGDRFVTRLWRIWHELRTPAPNKRQAFTHTWGRKYTGRLRAHPGRLDEVTPTVVPGERVTVELEGGWGRHVPLLDDFLSSPTPSVEHPVYIYSSLGVTTIALRGSWWQRKWQTLKIAFAYAELSDNRRNALGSDDPQERAGFLERLRRDFDAEISFELYPIEGNLGGSSAPRNLRVFFGDRGQEATQSPELSSAAAFTMPFFGDFEAWFERHAHYFLTDQGNDQASLSAVLFAILAYFLVDGYRRKRRVDLARAAVPLSIGGWGTRGKSGTERLKAAVFHGLGYRVFSKTTGCEAMLIHSVAEGPEVEIFVFRPYGKATIWEQRDLIELASQVKADVFMWECMALNPSYVSILQHEWMRDDTTTLTNAYPDHEDIQGPAGMNVAQVIGNFIPKGGSVYCSEINFIPVLRDMAEKQRCEFIQIDEDDGEWLGEDLLALLPYQEHPRNVALVATMSQGFGIERDLAIYNMCEYVVPDLGVLKIYPDVLTRGRTLRFINGCSANERTGFMNNWRRTGCDSFDADKDPGKMVITVVNNRDDRISRSEVFSRILVQDAACDRHVLIGTNLRGLMGYIENALHEFLEATRVVTVRDFDSDGSDSMRRLDRLMRRVRIPTPTLAAAESRFAIYASGIRLTIAPEGLQEVARAAFALIEKASDFPRELPAIRAAVVGDATLTQAMQKAIERLAHPLGPHALAEVIDPATKEEVVEHFHWQVSRMVASQQLRLHLRKCLQEKSAAGAEIYHEHLAKLYRELFLDVVDVVEDPGTKGDQIIDRIAKLLPPGTDVSIMGTQNIKGTGLDFVYRWTSLGIVTDLLKKAESSNQATRSEALSQLLSFGDHGVTDLGVMRDRLPRLTPRNADEGETIKRLIEKTDRLYEKRKNGLAVVAKKIDRLTKFYDWVEGWLEFLDGARRFHQSRSLTRDLANIRVSHMYAALEMRALYDRTKGGWLAKKLRGA
jgi:poly-gamma-glutamate synthase PgsB/CapB